MEEFKNMDKLKDDLFEAIEIICKDYESKHKPEFKAGQWVLTGLSDDPIRRIFAIKNDQVFLDYMDGEDQIEDKSPFPLNVIKRLATPAEIESHLKKIFDKKYIGKKVCSIYNITGIVKGQIYKYLFDSDEFIYDNGLTVYKQGKFAEIIEDKKKLPKTKEEFENFHKEYIESPLTFTFTKFLDQYED